MINKVTHYFLVSFVAYIAVYTTNTFNIAESIGEGFSALLRITITSLLITLFMAYTDEPVFKLVRKIMKTKTACQKNKGD